MPVTLRRVLFVFAALATALLLYGCDSAGPAVEEDPPEEDPAGDPSGNAVSVSLQAETNRQGVQLSWEVSGSGGADRFRIYRGKNADFDTTAAALADTTETSLQDTGLDPSAQYHYRVGAFEGDSALALSGEEKALSPPEEVSQLSGEGEFYRSALQWEEAGGAEEGYHVYRNDGPFSSASEATRVTGSPVHGEEFTDSTALDGEAYVYRVAAVGPEGHEGVLSFEVEVTPSFEGDPLAGKEIFRESCAVCHATPDATGLQTFSFPDTTIHRRDLAHISEEESFDVIEFIRSGDALRRENVHLGDPEVPPFQPGEKVLSSDKQFGIELFGKDEWPEDLTREELLKKRPTEQPLPFPMPEWSNETHRFDWIADRKVPDVIRQDPAVVQALGNYRSSPTDENLIQLWQAAQEAKPNGRTYLNAYRPEDVNSPERYADILERVRWIANLVGTHALRSENEIHALREVMEKSESLLPDRHGDPSSFHRQTPVKEIWSTGEIFEDALKAKRAKGFGHHDPDVHYPELPNSYESQSYGPDREFGDLKLAHIQWMYLSWMFAIDSSGIYLAHIAEHLGRPKFLGYPRVSAYVIGYTMAALPRNDSREPYNVLNNFPKSTPEHWQPELVPFVLENILRYIEEGNTLTAPDHIFDTFIERIQKTANAVLEENSYYDGENRDQIKDMRDQIIEYLKQQKENNEGSY